jgi:hypothetical protein
MLGLAEGSIDASLLGLSEVFLHGLERGFIDSILLGLEDGLY